MFIDCKTDLERNEYKRTKKLQQEVDIWLKQYQPDFYRIQRIGSYNEVLDAICDLVEIPSKEDRFLHFVDYRYLFDTTRGYRFENLTPDFEAIVCKGLVGMKYSQSELTNAFCADYNHTIDSLIRLAERIADTLEDRGDAEGAACFRNMVVQPACGLEEALQRILFLDQMFWQMGHRLVGLGRLDMILAKVYQKDIQAGKLSRIDALEVVCKFLQELHKYYWLKSNVLMGDTGQIIILGGKHESNQYDCNDLTYLFIEAIMQLQLPDPKILLRVSENMPRDLMELALKCMQTGVGSPILSNDDVVIPRLLDFGINKEDAHQYGTSACWEPLIPGKSISPNNMDYLSYPKVLKHTWDKLSEGQQASVSDFNQWMQAFYEELHTELRAVTDRISVHRLQYDPLLSVFTRDCYEKKQDVSYGGARYHNYGITTVGLANTVNALLNLRKLVFEENRYTFQEATEALVHDFEGYEKLQKELKNSGLKYGSDCEDVVTLTNEILHATTKAVEDYRNYMGGRLKLGVSAPSYVDAAKDFPATFDGRKQGEPFAVHISSDSGNAYTEILNFAAALDYGENRFNGNVVDIMVAPHFIENHFDKMIDLLLSGIDVGFFQLQMNVIGSDTLIDAKKNPAKYPNLVVRVWGFSAYFHELPEEYQDVLIKRALANEGKEIA